MSAFVPPQFDDLGKSVKNLFKKKYDYGNSMKTSHKTASGVTLDNTAVFADSISGRVKGTYKDETFGDIETEVATRGNLSGKVSLKKLADGLNVALKGNVNADSQLTAGVDMTYAQEFFACSSKISVAKTAGIDLAGTIGFDGLSVGGQVKLDVSAAAQEFVDFNVGFQYDTSDLSCTLKTQKKGDVIAASAFHTVNPGYKVGGEFLYSPYASADKQYKLTIGSDYKLDDDTNIKAKLDTLGVFATAIEHKLTKPNVKLGLAASFNRASKNAIVADKFGLTVTLG